MTEAAEGGLLAGSVDGAGTALEASAWMGDGFVPFLGGFGASFFHTAALPPLFRVILGGMIIAGPSFSGSGCIIYIKYTCAGLGLSRF